jgi:hypothetical protein
VVISTPAEDTDGPEHNITFAMLQTKSTNKTIKFSKIERKKSPHSNTEKQIILN